MTDCCVFVHVGAGNHDSKKYFQYKTAMTKACMLAMDLLLEKKTAHEAVALAIKTLEDNPVTNAGVGSNLTRNGLVQCDASIMRSQDLAFGAVGAVSGIQNPILAAEKIMINESLGQQSLGLICPMILVGNGAKNWAKQNGIKCTEDPNYHIT
ncbi:hypothetical protein BB560_001083, partial [Smittium megazygosporum]